MRWVCCARNVISLLVVIASLAYLAVAPARAKGQENAERPTTTDARSAKADEPIQAIDDDYNRQVLELDRRRLEQLGRLAAGQKPADAAATYERLFRLAIADDLFRDAEAAAGKRGRARDPFAPRPTLWPIWSRSSPRPTAGPLNSRCKACARPSPKAWPNDRRLRLGLPLPPARSSESARPTISAWSKRISSRSRREAFRLVLEKPYRPAVKDFLASRLKRIELVGKPAPPDPGNGPGRQGVQPRR